MSKIKILRVIPVLDFGGVETLFINMAESWNRPKDELQFCTFWKDGAAAATLRSLGFTVHVLDENPSIRNPKATFKLWKLLKELNPSVVHASIGEANFHSMLCAVGGNWKTLIDEAGVPNRSLQNRAIHALLYRICDGILPISAAAKDYIVQKEWAPIDRITIVPGCINQRFFSRKSIQPFDRRTLIFRAVGRLTAVKNYSMLVRAFAQAHTTSPNIRLEIVGEGEDRGILEALIRELNAGDYIILRGFVANIAALHQDSDFFLMPSLSEGFGLAAAEPMAMGIPGLGSQVGGLVTVFGPLADSWLLPPEDSSLWAARIAKLAQLPEHEYREIAELFSSRASVFSPKHYVEQLENVYRRYLRKPRCSQ